MEISVVVRLATKESAQFERLVTAMEKLAATTGGGDLTALTDTLQAHDAAAKAALDAAQSQGDKA